ncbi:MAG: hypothetical protein EBY30_03275 [Rhodospirillales bacterium]|nr:hypothetical protein [Rhodospirillales bacterium]
MSLGGVVKSGICVRSLQQNDDEEVAYGANRKLFEMARDPDRAPLFMTVSSIHPHNPFFTTREYWDCYDPAEIDMPAVAPIPFDQQGGRSQRHHLLTRADEHAVTPERLLATHTERWGAIARSVGARRRPAGLRLAPLARRLAIPEEG